MRRESESFLEGMNKVIEDEQERRRRKKRGLSRKRECSGASQIFLTTADDLR